jgi:hypothetical protein
MKLLKGLAWVMFFFIGIVLGNSPAALDLVPLWLLIALWICPWAYVIAKYRKEGNTAEVVQVKGRHGLSLLPRPGLKSTD